MLKSPRVKNIRSISVRNQGSNSRVKRLNGTVSEHDKVMLGMRIFFSVSNFAVHLSESYRIKNVNLFLF